MFPHGKNKPSLCLFGADAIYRRRWPGLSVTVGIRDRIPPRVAVWLDREELWWLTRGLRVWWLRVARGSVGCYDVRAPSRFFSFAATGSALRVGVQSPTGLIQMTGDGGKPSCFGVERTGSTKFAGSDREGNFPAARRPGTRRGQGEPGMTGSMRVRYARGG